MAWIAVTFHWKCSHTAVSTLCFLEGVLKKSKCKLNVIHCIALRLSSEQDSPWLWCSPLFIVLNCPMLSQTTVLHSWGCEMTVSALRYEHKIFVITKWLLPLERKVSSSPVICICLAGKYVASQIQRA